MEAQNFKILIQRLHREDRLVTGSLYVNGELIGATYENDDLKVEAGPYIGVMRYRSDHNFVQGQFGLMSTTGDFLIELVGAKDRTNILLHGGNKPHQSRGCILLGPVIRDKATNTGFVGEEHTLRKLRTKFYRTELPNQCPFMQIFIQIIDAKN
jgi:hypothetical protein